MTCDHPWFQLTPGKGWHCSVCGSDDVCYNDLYRERRRAAAIDEAVRRTRGKYWSDTNVGLVFLPSTFRAMKSIAAEFARIMAQDDLESAGSGRGMR